MTNKVIYNSGFPIFSIILYTLPLVFTIVFLFKGLSISASLLYGLLLLFIAIILNRKNQWIRMYNDRLVLIRLKPFFKRTEILVDTIESVEAEEGIDSTFIAGHFVSGIPDRLFVNYKNGDKSDFVMLRTVGLDSDNPLYALLINNFPGYKNN